MAPRGRVIPTFAPRILAAAAPAVERVQIHEDALAEGATPAVEAEIMRGLNVRHPHGTGHALCRCARGSYLLCANTSTSVEGADGAASPFCRVL
jgi:hypothetical protein